MSWLRFFRRSRADAELQQELDAYLAEEMDENIARGVKPEEARRQAKIKLGNPQSVRETLWQQNTISMVDTLGRDLKYATQNTRANAGLFADRGHRGGLVHRRHYLAVHGCALGAAEAASLSRSQPPGYAL